MGYLLAYLCGVASALIATLVLAVWLVFRSLAEDVAQAHEGWHEDV